MNAVGDLMPSVHEMTGAETSGTYRSVDFPPRVTIIDDGEPARAIYQVVKGSVMVSKLLPDGRRQIFEVLGPGGIFGLTPNGHHDSMAESLTNVRVTAFEKNSAENSSHFNSVMANLLKVQLCALHDHAVLLGRKSALERVTSYILEQIEAGNSMGDPVIGLLSVRILMTRSEIADYLGLTLETVSRAFSQLRRMKIISYQRHDDLIHVHVDRLRPLTGTY
jgi:CRP/FNR family transcriptional regulator, anaerobic regulatory protein